MSNYERKRNDRDEYYTSYDSIHKFFISDNVDITLLSGRTIYCNCDDYRWSSFVKFFKENFKLLNIRLLIATNYNIGDGAYIYTYDGENEKINDGILDGSYDKYESIIKEYDPIVITNPPFSKYKDYINFIFKNDTDYILISTYDNCFNFFGDKINEVTASKSLIKFISSYEHLKDLYTKKFDDGNCIHGTIWIDNINFIKNTNSKVKISTKLNDINRIYTDEGHLLLNRCEDIPIDYYDVMLVPITFLVLQPNIRDMFKIIKNKKFNVPKGCYKRAMIIRR